MTLNFQPSCLYLLSTGITSLPGLCSTRDGTLGFVCQLNHIPRPSHHPIFIEQLLFDKSSSRSSERDVGVESSEGLLWRNRARIGDGLISRSPNSSQADKGLTKTPLCGGLGTLWGEGSDLRLRVQRKKAVSYRHPKVPHALMHY